MTGSHFPGGDQPLDTPLAEGRMGWAPFVVRLAVVGALVFVGVAVTVDTGPEPMEVDARAGWERLDIDPTGPTSPSMPSVSDLGNPRAPTVPDDAPARPPRTDQPSAKESRATTTVSIEVPDPPAEDQTVARAIPEHFEAAAPPSAEPAWAKTTHVTDAGLVTTDLGCADGTSAAALDKFFRERSGPVIGHDYQHVYPLGGDRHLWVFQDTFLDHPGVADRLDQARFAHNTAMVQDGECFSLYHRGTALAPQSFEPGVGEEPLSRWFWPMGGELADGTLSVFWVEMLNVDQDLGPNDGLGWYPIRTWLGTYDAETLARLDFRLAPNSGVSPIYGYAVASDDKYSYLFGNSFDQNLYRQGGYANGPHSATAMWLARTPRGELDAAPEYRTADGWSDDSSAARPITQRYWAENPMQPRYLGGQWVAATKVDGYWGKELAIDVANEPWGPWTTVAQGPAEPRDGDSLMLTYHAYLMPWLSDGALVVSLSQNARLMLRDAWPHPARYRMRFVPAALIEPPPSPPTTTQPPKSTTTATTTTRPRPTTTTRPPRPTTTTTRPPTTTTTRPPRLTTTTTQLRPPAGTTTSTTTTVTTPTTPVTAPTTPVTAPTTPVTAPTTPTTPVTTPTTPVTTPTTPVTTPTTPATTPTTPVTDPPSTCPVQEGQTVWEILDTCLELSKARDYVEQAGLRDLLDDIEAPMTLLAPTNDAFEQLEQSPGGSELLADDEQLRDLMERHILQGRVRSGELFADEELETFGGDVLAVDLENETIEDATVEAPDLEEGNGVVHAIDLVLLP